jgi:hypothetical protein
MQNSLTQFEQDSQCVQLSFWTGPEVIGGYGKERLKSSIATKNTGLRELLYVYTELCSLHRTTIDIWRQDY